MREPARVLRWLRMCAVAVWVMSVPLCGQNPAPSSAATSAIALKPPPCGRISYVAAETDKPFSGEWRTESTGPSRDGGEKTMEYYELVARDSAGRIRLEKRRPDLSGGEKKIVLNTSDGGTITTSAAELGIVVLIFDKVSGRTTQLQPAMRIARLSEAAECSAPKMPGRL